MEDFFRVFLISEQDRSLPRSLEPYVAPLNRLLVLPVNIILGRKPFPGTNTSLFCRYFSLQISLSACPWQAIASHSNVCQWVEPSRVAYGLLQTLYYSENACKGSHSSLFCPASFCHWCSGDITWIICIEKTFAALSNIFGWVHHGRAGSRDYPQNWNTC